MTLPSRTACRSPAEPRGGVKLERIGKVGVDTAQQHLGALQAGNGAHEDAVVAHAQIFALDHEKAEIARQIGVLEIGLAHRSGRQHANVRVVLPAERCELGLKSLKERGEALGAARSIDVGDGARQREPVLDRIAGAGWRLRPVAEHPPAAVGAACDIDRIESQMRAAGRCDADQRAQEFRIAGDDRRRQMSVAGEM
jgi:hypothetical protein